MGLRDLPLDKGRIHIKVFESLGWVLRRSEKNHYVLTNDRVPNVYISIPDHDEVDRRLLHDEIRKADLNDKEYRKHYDKL